MSAEAIEQPLEVTSPAPPTESKSAAKKRKAKEAAAANGAATAVPAPAARDTNSEPRNEDGSYEHPHIRELQKQIRAINKRLAGLSKTDAVQSENPGVSLDDLVNQKKINPDQKAAAEKKPGLQSQLQQAEEQVKIFREVDAGYQSQLSKLKEDAAREKEREVEKVKEELQTEHTSTSSSELRKKLLIFSQFLRTAAAKRNTDDSSDPLENEAFEGALLLAYGGDEKAVGTAISIIEGTDDKVPNIEGNLLEVRYSQIRKVSAENTPFQTEEAWVDSVAEANAAVEGQQSAAAGEEAPATDSDPTLVNATLNEQADVAAPLTNGVHRESITSPANADAGDSAGNAAGDRWDTNAGPGAETDEGYEIVPRPNDEVDVPAPAAAAPAVESLLKEEKTSWADEATAAASAPSAVTAGVAAAEGNAAGESWDTPAAGQTEAAPATNGWADEVAATEPVKQDDGFQEIPARPQGGRGRGGRGNGEFRGRGGGRGRGEGGRGGRGEFRGRGSFRGDRGDRGGYRGDGEGRGRGGRGRGAPRGDGGAPRGS